MVSGESTSKLLNWPYRPTVFPPDNNLFQSLIPLKGNHFEILEGARKASINILHYNLRKLEENVWMSTGMMLQTFEISPCAYTSHLAIKTIWLTCTFCFLEVRVNSRFDTAEKRSRFLNSGGFFWSAHILVGLFNIVILLFCWGGRSSLFDFLWRCWFNRGLEW